MGIKVDPKIYLGIATTIGTAAVAGGIAYYKSAKFKKWVDNEFYPQLKKIVKDNGAFAIRTGIEIALVNHPKSKLVFLNIVNAIEAGKVKLPKFIEKELYAIKEELPVVTNILNQNAIALNTPSNN